MRSRPISSVARSKGDARGSSEGATDYLSARGVENPRRDAELLLARALGLARIELYTHTTVR